MWKLNKDFSSFIGSEVKAFIDNIPKIVSFLHEKFISTERLGSLIKGLQIWPDLVSFLNLTKIGQGDEDNYLERLDTFEEQLKSRWEVFFNERERCGRQ